MIEVAKIREGDYYGGDVILSYGLSEDIVLEWKSWGRLRRMYAGTLPARDALQAAPWREDAEAAREAVT